VTQTDKSLAPSDASVRLSLCMIVKNEEYFLERCLSCVEKFVDEVIVVDTGSTDRTREIAAEFTENVYALDWDDDFSRARNFSLGKATGDWILVLDADELIAESDLQSIRETILDTEYDAFSLIQFNYNNDHLAKDWQPVRQASKYSGDYLGYRRNPIGRLFRNHKDIHYSGRVHEVIDLSLEGLNTTTLEIPIHHHMDDDPTKPRRDRQLNYLRIIEKELQNRPDGRLYASAATVYMYTLNDYATAIRYFQRALDLGYDQSVNLECLAEAHYRLNQWRESFNIYMQLFRSGYVTFSLCNNLANLLVKNGNFSGAVKLLKISLTQGTHSEETIARINHNIQYLENQVDKPSSV
jgi:glycosyltransferase involved in cell wall biosynthesis